MISQFSRSELIFGQKSTEILKKSRVAVFGVGGVGGYAVEALVRAGISDITVVDNDTVSESNINRQIIATHSTVGMYKTEAMRDRILSINPDAKVICHSVFFNEENKADFDFASYDYVIDAIDSLSAKVELIASAKAAGSEIISAMGAGNKLDPTAFEVADIYKTSVCPLARVMRTELRKRGVKRLKVVYSKEPPVINNRVPASIAFVPSVAGLIAAGEAVKTLVNNEAISK